MQQRREVRARHGSFQANHALLLSRVGDSSQLSADLSRWLVSAPEPCLLAEDRGARPRPKPLSPAVEFPASSPWVAAW